MKAPNESNLWGNIYPSYNMPEANSAATEQILSDVSTYIAREVDKVLKSGRYKGWGPVIFMESLQSGYRNPMDTRLTGLFDKLVFMGRADSLAHFIDIELAPDEEGYQMRYLYKWDAVHPLTRARQIAAVYNNRFEGGNPIALSTGFEPRDIARISSIMEELGHPVANE